MTHPRPDRSSPGYDHLARAVAQIDQLSEAFAHAPTEMAVFEGELRRIGRELYRALGQPPDGEDAWVERVVDRGIANAREDVETYADAIAWLEASWEEHWA